MRRREIEKVVVIGIDGAIPELVKKFAAEGVLHNISELMKNGVFSELLSAVYTDTPTNWTTIATGA